MSLLNAISRKAQTHGTSALGSRQGAGTRQTIQAPVGGWNTRDAQAAMKPKYAIRMDNYFPETGACRLRKGYRTFATDVGTGDVEALFTHESGSVKQLYAAGSGGIYEVTDGREASPVAISQKGNRWHSSHIAGQTVLVNGQDGPKRIAARGTIVTANEWTGITTPSNLFRALTFKNRVYFLEKGTAKMYYGPIASYAGALTSFDLGNVHPYGGNVLDFGTITVDAGSGIDDLMCIFMDSGAVLVYQGTDPANADTWAIVGIWNIGRLVGDRPLVKVGGDLIAITSDGYVPMSKMLTGGRVAETQGIALSETISSTVTAHASVYGGIDGWDCILHTPANWLLFNVPVPGGEQHVMNTQTGAWCRFIGWDARVWARFNDKLYFGDTKGRVCEANIGHNDDGTAIEGDVQGAFSYMGSPSEKRFTLARALIEADSSISFQLGATTDFNEEGPLSTASALVSEGAAWNASPWNDTGWGGGRVTLQEWQALDRNGTAISMRLRTSTTGANITYYAADIISEQTQGIL